MLSNYSPFVYYNHLWDPEPIDYVFPDELEGIPVFDVGIGLSLYPFAEVIGSYK